MTLKKCLFAISVLWILSIPTIAFGDFCYSEGCGTPFLRDTYTDESCPNDPSEVCSYEIWQRNCDGADCEVGTQVGILHDCTLLNPGPGQNFDVLLINLCGTENEVSKVYLYGLALSICDESKCFFNCDDDDIPYMELEDSNCPDDP